MFTKFWMWLLGFKDENKSSGANDNKTGGQASPQPSSDEEGDFRSGLDGYQGEGYDGR
jgi:hypothetical protein